MNVAPSEAKKIIAVKQSTSEKVDEIAINTDLDVTSKNLGNFLYKFGLLSDIHLDGDGTDTSYSLTDFQKELEYFDSNYVDFIAITGDLTYDGRIEDFQAYQNLVNQYASGKTILAARGNHDTYTDISNWNTYVDSNGLNYEFEHSGDKFLVLGLNAEDFSGNFITDEQMTWLITKLNTYRNQRCFLLFHVFVDPCGNVNSLYPYSTLSGTKGNKFKELMTHFKNLIFISGHSHLDYRLQKYGETANIMSDGTTCHRIHTPSGSKPRQNDTGTSSSDTYSYNQGCEGAIVEVYENGLIINGRDFEINKNLPIASYAMPISLVTVEEYTESSTGAITPVMELGSISRSNGTTSDATDTIRTADFVEVEASSTYKITNNTADSSNTCILQYDENKNFITAWNGEYSYAFVDSGGTVETTATTKYLKARISTSDVSTVLTIEKQ